MKELIVYTSPKSIIKLLSILINKDFNEMDSGYFEQRYFNACPSCGGSLKVDSKYGGSDCVDCYTTWENNDYLISDEDIILITSDIANKILPFLNFVYLDFQENLIKLDILDKSHDLNLAKELVKKFVPKIYHKLYEKVLDEQ